MAGKGGGAWKVAYADFVTAMMAFFLVMWITSQSKDVKQAVAHYFRDPLMPTSKFERPGLKVSTYKRGAASQAKRSRGRGIADPVAEPPSGDGKGDGASRPHLLGVYDGTRSTLGATIVFAEDSAELSDRAKLRLKNLVPTLAGKPNKIEIRGHASRRPLPPNGPFRDVWQLCYARCQATMEYLEQQGLEPARLRLAQAGPYEQRTLSAAEAEGKSLRESRVEIYMLAEFAEDPASAHEDKGATPKSH